MVESDENGAQVLFTPYYELRHHSDDNMLLAQVVVTSGGERVPPGHRHTGPFAGNLIEAYENGIVEQVMEVYFSNRSGASIEVRLRCMAFLDKNFSDIEFPFWVPARGSCVTPGLITLGSNLGTKMQVKISYEYADKRYDVAGVARRLVAEELAVTRFGESLS